MKNEFLRHLIATIYYRFDKSIADRTADFEGFSLGKGSRTSEEIVHHMHHVLFATRVFIAEERMIDQQPEKLSLAAEIKRFKDELNEVDRVLDVNELPINYAKKLIQGPFSDLLTHVGQLAMLQRLNDKPIAAEDFSAAAIKTGLK